MPPAAPPGDEELRLRTLYAYTILDTMEERAFDDICEVAASICDTPTALVTLVDRRRQWFKARYHFPVRETERECSFCAHAIEQGSMMVVEDATKDSRFVDNRLVLSSPHIRFYAGVPVRAVNDQQLGTLCVIDQRPRQLEQWQLDALHALRRQVETQLELRRVQHDKDLLGRFVIHDMRNPLSSLIGNAQLAVLDHEQGKLEVHDLQELGQAAALLKRRVDEFHALMASEHGGLPVHLQDVDVTRIVDELEKSLRVRLAEQGVRLEVSLQAPVFHADPDLLRRLLENLVYNALAVAPRGTPIRVETWAENDDVVLRVSDEGPGVPEEARDSIFELYRRGPNTTQRGSTGLGLAFCKMAARAMGGTITLEDPGVGAALVLELPQSKG